MLAVVPTNVRSRECVEEISNIAVTEWSDIVGSQKFPAFE